MECVRLETQCVGVRDGVQIGCFERLRALRLRKITFPVQTPPGDEVGQIGSRGGPPIDAPGPPLTQDVSGSNT